MLRRSFWRTCGLLVVVILCISRDGTLRAGPQNAAAEGSHSFYVDSEHGADTNPGTQSGAWKTLKNLDGRTFAPGDTIYFARGSSFTGGFTISSSGSEGRPITFTAYGTGPAPKFTNPDYAVSNGNAIRVDGSYIVIDGLYFSDCAMAPPRNRGVGASGAGGAGGGRSGAGRSGGGPGAGGSPSHKMGVIFILVNSSHNIVRNCELTRSPFPIHVYGQHNLITHNYVHDLMDIPEASGWYAVGIMLCNSNNEASYNHIVNCRQKSASYGFDGGAFELDDRDFPKDNIQIHHNVASDNQGFLEVVEGSVSLKNLLVAYNVVNDYQQFLRLSSTEIENARVENNTVILTRQSVLPPSMFDFSWFGTIGSGKSCGTRPPASILTYRNNIFYLGNNFRVSPYCDFPHDHNIYWRPRDRPLRGWAMLGADADWGPGDQAVDPKFVNMAEGDYHLQSDSPAIRAGAPLGYTRDADDKPVPARSPDIGAYQHQ